MDDTTHQPTRKLSKSGDQDSKNMPLTSNLAQSQKKSEMEDSFPDYPEYPPSEDIYHNYTRESEVDPEQPSRLKDPVILSDLINQLDFSKALSADELDVPGAELDDAQEFIGSEDEENNYYSLGGDNHESLDETNDGL